MGGIITIPEEETYSILAVKSYYEFMLINQDNDEDIKNMLDSKNESLLIEYLNRLHEESKTEEDNVKRLIFFFIFFSVLFL